MSGRPGSNWPPQPWQGCALPNELLPLKSVVADITPVVTTRFIHFERETRLELATYSLEGYRSTE